VWVLSLAITVWFDRIMTNLKKMGRNDKDKARKAPLMSKVVMAKLNNPSNTKWHIKINPQKGFNSSSGRFLNNK